MEEGGRKSFGVNWMSGWPVLGNILEFGIDQPILRSPRPHLGSKVIENISQELPFCTLFGL